MHSALAESHFVAREPVGDNALWRPAGALSTWDVFRNKARPETTMLARTFQISSSYFPTKLLPCSARSLANSVCVCEN